MGRLERNQSLQLLSSPACRVKKQPPQVPVIHHDDSQIKTWARILKCMYIIVRQSILNKDCFLFADGSSVSEKSLNTSSNARRGIAGVEQRRMVDITRDKPIKVTVRVIVPVRDHPKVSEQLITAWRTSFTAKITAHFP